MQPLPKTALPRGRLIVEITESVAIGDPVSAKRVLRECQNRGLRVALDDFGTGYSSLRHLIDFTVHIVKIDRSFVGAIPEHSQSVVIAGTFGGERPFSRRAADRPAPPGPAQAGGSTASWNQGPRPGAHGAGPAQAASVLAPTLYNRKARKVDRSGSARAYDPR